MFLYANAFFSVDFKFRFAFSNKKFFVLIKLHLNNFNANWFLLVLSDVKSKRISHIICWWCVIGEKSMSKTFVAVCEGGRTLKVRAIDIDWQRQQQPASSICTLSWCRKIKTWTWLRASRDGGRVVTSPVTYRAGAVARHGYAFIVISNSENITHHQFLLGSIVKFQTQ